MEDVQLSRSENVSTPGARPSLIFICDHQMTGIHVGDGECEEQCLFKLDPEHIQVEIHHPE